MAPAPMYWATEDSDDEERDGTGRRECRSKSWAHEDKLDESCKIREGRRDGFSKNHEDRRDGLSEIREDRDDGLVWNPRRKTCIRPERTDGTTNAKRSNKFDVFESNRKGIGG